MTKILLTKFILAAWLIAVIINFMALYKSRKQINEISEDTGMDLKFIWIICVLISFLGPFAWLFGFINIKVNFKK